MSTCCYKDLVDTAEVCGGALAGVWDDDLWFYEEDFFGAPLLTNIGSQIEYTATPISSVPVTSCKVVYEATTGGGTPSTNAKWAREPGQTKPIEKLYGVARITAGLDVGDTIDWSVAIADIAPSDADLSVVPATQDVDITIVPNIDGVSAELSFETTANTWWHMDEDNFINDWKNGCFELANSACNTGSFGVAINVTASVAGKGAVVFNFYFRDEYFCF